MNMKMFLKRMTQAKKPNLVHKRAKNKCFLSTVFNIVVDLTLKNFPGSEDFLLAKKH